MNPLKPLSVSIIIPNYNGKALLERYLPAVLKAATHAEIIIVDDASTDNSVAFLHQHYPEIKVISLKNNVRFAKACNVGVNEAKGEIVILLNTDVSPDVDFLNPLLQVFDDERVFAAGCREIQTIDSKQVVSGRSGGTFSQGLVTHWRSIHQDGSETFWAAGGSAAFRKTIWQELRGLDSLFSPAYEEDRDISYRALKRGYLVRFAPTSVVYHNHETTNAKALGKSLITASSYKNHLLFVWKNITSIKLILEHLWWLPYHLVVTTIRSKGIFLIGFVWALTLLPLCIRKRQQEIREVKIRDESILEYYSQL